MPICPVIEGEVVLVEEVILIICAVVDLPNQTPDPLAGSFETAQRIFEHQLSKNLSLQRVDPHH